MVCDHLVIYAHKNKIPEERADFLYLIDTGVCGIFLCIGYLRGFYVVHYYIIENFVSLSFLQLVLM